MKKLYFNPKIGIYSVSVKDALSESSVYQFDYLLDDVYGSLEG